MNVYLDHAAATDLFPEALKKMNEVLALVGNPSSVHSNGRKVRSVLDEARRDAADVLGCTDEEIIFTSGGTEAIHLAMVGSFLSSDKNTVLISPIAHSCIQRSAEFIRDHLGGSIEYIKLDENGQFVWDSIDGGVALIAIDHVNSEIGILQDVSAVPKNVPVVVDAAASIVTEDIDFKNLNIDFLAISAEKFGGPSGAGILVKRKKAPMKPIVGGSHEWGMRGGTENVSGIVGMVTALKIWNEMKSEQRKKFEALQSFLRENLNYQITTPEKSAPHILHFLLPTGDSETFVAKADMAGFSISAGAACSSGTTKPSRALKALGYSDEQAKRGVRVSFGRSTTKKGVEEFLEYYEN